MARSATILATLFCLAFTAAHGAPVTLLCTNPGGVRLDVLTITVDRTEQTVAIGDRRIHHGDQPRELPHTMYFLDVQLGTFAWGLVNTRTHDAYYSYTLFSDLGTLTYSAGSLQVTYACHETRNL